MRVSLVALVGILALAAVAGASQIPGANNEIINGEFNAVFDPWVVNPGDVRISDYGHVGTSAQCNRATLDWGDKIRQVVDDSTGVYWNPDLHAKVIDLEAWISIDVKDDAVGGVRFRLDWWDETPYNQWPNPPSETDPGYHVTPWVEYTSAQGYGVTFTYVNPFDNYHLLLGEEQPVQPKWISVEIEFLQPSNVINRVDSVVLTSKCVPEPPTTAALLAGLGGIRFIRFFRRKSR
jgi:hypothetical protein